jgi:hypothetical protein
MCMAHDRSRGITGTPARAWFEWVQSSRRQSSTLLWAVRRGGLDRIYFLRQAEVT